MRILLLNQYFPPDPAPTGILLAELAERLREDGHEVALISSGKEYREGQRSQGGRMRRELSALRMILLAGWRAGKADLVISASSPPLLLVAATLIAIRHRARSIHWAMDLYPELALQLEEIGPGLIETVCSALMGWCYRRTSRVVALDEDMATHLQTYQIRPLICRPWVFAPVLDRLRDALERGVAPQEPWTWVYSGNLGRAHEWETLLQAQQVIEERHGSIHLLFQGGGPTWPAARARAAQLGLCSCDWHDYCDEENLPSSLLRCAVTVATQRPETEGLLWPSKLGLLLALPRPILWIGTRNGAIGTRLLRDGMGVFEPGEGKAVAEWILQQHANSRNTPALENPNELRETALTWWSTLVNDVLDRRREC